MSTPRKEKTPTAAELHARELVAALMADHESSLRNSVAPIADHLRQRLARVAAGGPPGYTHICNVRMGFISLYVADGQIFVDPETEFALNAHLAGLLLGLKLVFGNILTVGRPGVPRE